MLTIFRTNQPFANILLLLYLALVRASTFIHPMSFVPKSQGVLTQWMYAELAPTSLSGQIAAFVLVFIQAVFINITMSRYRVSTELSLLPGLFYCLMTSMIPEFMMLSPILLANTFLILAFFYLCDIYKNNLATSMIFDVGLWIGVACLFHFSFILFILWGIIGLGILRGLRPKELLMILIGIVVPFFLFAVYLFWTDRLSMFPLHFTENFGFLNFIKNSNQTGYVKIAVMLLLVLITLFSSGQFFIRRNISAQKYISIIYWMLLMGGLTILIQKGVDVNHLLILSVPLSILLSMLFQRIGPATAEVLHMLLLVVAMLFQYQYLLNS